MMLTATIVNQKGGVCKTTICQNLGPLLATKYHKRVLLIDLDSSGNLSNFFGVRPAPDNELGAARVLNDIDCAPTENIVPTRFEGVFVMPGNQTLGVTERNIKSDDFTPQQYRLKMQLEKVQKDYDYCFIDCPPTVNNSVIVINALSCSDDVIIPCTPNMNSMDGVGAIADMVNKARRFYNPSLAIRGVVFCRITRKTLDKMLLQQQLAVPRFRTYIREGTGVAEYSLAESLTFVESDPRSKATHDMENFAAEYLGEAFPYPDELPPELKQF